MTGVEQARIDAIKGCTTWGEADAAIARVDACVAWFTSGSCLWALGSAMAMALMTGPVSQALSVYDMAHPPP